MKKSFFAFIVFVFIILTGCTGGSGKNSFKIITFNIRYDNPYDSINAWPERAQAVCNFIINEKPDIVGIQEVLYHQYEFLDSALTGYVSAGAGRDDGVKAGEMNPVFFKKSKFDMVRTLTFWLSDTPEIPGSKGWGASLPRIVTWMELAEKNSHKHFFCFNTHFAHDSDSARIMSSTILLKEIELIAKDSPFILTGDFNMFPGSESYAILTGPAESVPLLRDSYIISGKKPSGPDYTFNGFSDKPGSGRIDYIFVREGMKVLDHSTIIKKERGIYISDHWPVEARIVIW
jgi:endonuclease/exonuclease/phosphatase family metal-dependent hydrolase